MSERVGELSPQHRARLHEVARLALEQGVRTGQKIKPELALYPAALCAWRGCFVTLQKDGRLRGCLGSLDAAGPLVQEVARLAYAAAKRDPRFSPVTEDELPAITIKLSVLSAPEAMVVASEAQLLLALRPGIDGVIFSDAGRSATFLPDVWQSFPSPQAFIDQLRTKAGLPARHWSEQVKVQRYTTQSF